MNDSMNSLRMAEVSPRSSPLRDAKHPSAAMSGGETSTVRRLL